MSSSTLRLAVVIASVREGRFGPVVARWFADQARLHGGFEVDVIDLAEATLPTELPAVPLMAAPDPARPAGMVELTRRLGLADAVVIVTPDINRSYPASVKTAIDWHYAEWDRKVVGFVGYGGGSGGLYAIGHLREVLNELNAHTVRDYVSFPRYFELFDEEGKPHEPAGPEAAAVAMLDQLRWWAAAVAQARAGVM
ncbi:NAD(P)H-dependent oxidoreductase [Nocardia sp. CDC159]|uniref:NAD(P)H-dependent oxidoreductase n=1 Tax=Nocardia pulmonis TaxID=2951408 RepID=A0A9X2E8J9_9NOCA|nr:MULTISPECIES: NAD(P)H-dependent oxidoreductase [Nocardia]MCM6776292.1 NAD(P)H-dependent oxidoreductase [Nocardia pulmonis]MCM6788716.1 NAD(P)H-dependent oxidoreductase [Nocardia sp. CDC159]